MKKLILTVTLLLAAFGVACADVDRPITIDQLPQKAQHFLQTHFAQVKVSFAKEDAELFSTEYEVLLADGAKIEFDGDGDWQSVDCRFGVVPVAILPQPIAAYVAQNFPDAKVTKIEIERGEYEVSLSNRLEITFNKSFRVIDIDD